MGKGSIRRPMDIKPEEYDERYDKIFVKKCEGTKKLDK